MNGESSVELIGIRSSAQSLILGKPDNEIVENSEEESEEEIEDSVQRNVGENVDADISTIAARIDAQIIIQRDSSDDETIPVLDENDEIERELVE